MSVRRPVLIGWAMLVAGGWAATLWLGEPSATAGPGPASPGVSTGNPEPGPQPESGRCETPRAERTPPAGATSGPYDARGMQGTAIDCAYIVVRSTAR